MGAGYGLGLSRLFPVGAAPDAAAAALARLSDLGGEGRIHDLLEGRAVRVRRDATVEPLEGDEAEAVAAAAAEVGFARYEHFRHLDGLEVLWLGADAARLELPGGRVVGVQPVTWLEQRVKRLVREGVAVAPAARALHEDLVRLAARARALEMPLVLGS